MTSSSFYNPKVSVIIPNWNGRHLLKDCLESLGKQTFKDFEIILIDNGSTDGSQEYIKENYPAIKLTELPTNIGFAPAINLGVKICCGEYMVLLNNDTKIDKDCLKYLAKAADQNSNVGMVAAKMLSFDDPNVIDSAGDYIDAVGHADNIGRGQPDSDKYNKSGYVFLVTGGGSLIKREVFERVGFFDQDYFAYMEDVDFCFRAQLAGFKGWYEPKAVVLHRHAATSKKDPAFKEYLQYRNMTQTVIKDFPKKLLFKDLNWLKIILVNLNTIRFLGGKGYLIQALKAEWYILTNFLSLLNKRKVIQSMQAVTDDYILENVKPKKITFFGLLKKGI
jgi:GT2 family glycosyltransferase